MTAHQGLPIYREAIRLVMHLHPTKGTAMPYYPRVIPSGETFDAIVDAHWAPAIWVSHGHDTEQDAQEAAQVTARGLNLRDYEALVAAGFTEADLPTAEAQIAALDEQLRDVEPLTKNEASPLPEDDRADNV